MSDRTQQGISLTQRGSGLPVGGHKWLKRVVTDLADGTWRVIATATNGPVCILHTVVRWNAYSPASFTGGNIVADNRQCGLTSEPAGNFYSYSAGDYRQIDGVGSIPGGPGYYHTSTLVPAGEDVEIYLGGPGTESVDLTVYLGYEPLVYGAVLL